MTTDKNLPLPSEPNTEQVQARKAKTGGSSRRGALADVMEAIGSWVTGAVIVAVAAACLFGPAFVSELREDEIMSVLDLSDEQLEDTPMGDLVDIRKYVDEYETDDEVNRRAAEKAGKILDSTIEQRLDRN
ncbi:hypothetical protein [Arthrobacter sp. zg-Y1110]|uniref:hypothetical protein n=1 Tax=Arthrobacter sp. zg-Y1110 TaxID=2886932 RepID=UPI001D14F2F3|nr:hypothetical protein [Arthrobacter sp. zg-Y1110]MCC3292972.1 hypothetical protein [Arthrobacter sp. zg-Y1110]UWX86911.1 hypothetical protein N2K99_18885 [Arthrobacter sp. zg-Y1110]